MPDLVFCVVLSRLLKLLNRYCASTFSITSEATADVIGLPPVRLVVLIAKPFWEKNLIGISKIPLLLFRGYCVSFVAVITVVSPSTLNQSNY
jgi:hypothetical protein